MLDYVRVINFLLIFSPWYFISKVLKLANVKINITFLGLATLPGNVSYNNNELGIYQFENTAYSSGQNVSWELPEIYWNSISADLLDMLAELM